MKNRIPLIASAGLIAACICPFCIAFAVLSLITLGEIGYNIPPQDPTPTAVPILHAGNGVGQDTLAELSQVRVPENDPADLAHRLGGLDQPIPPTVPFTNQTLTTGAQQSFWASDTDTDENFLIEATLHYITPHAYFWVENGVRFDMDDLASLAEEFENAIYPTVRAFFGSEWSPGIDNDPHIYIVYASGIGGDIAGYFSSADEVHPLAHEYSNAHEMFFLSADNASLKNSFTYGVLAHEFQHMIHWNGDRNEETWMNEGFSEIAVLLTGYYDGGFDVAYARDPDIPLTAWPENGPTTPYYGGAFLYLTYILDRFGGDTTRSIVSHPENGMQSIDLVLGETAAQDTLRGITPTADSVFQDFSIALYLGDPSVSDGRFDYAIYEQAPNSAQTETVDACPAGPFSRDVNQYGIDYVHISCRGEYTLLFSGSTVTPVLPVDPYSGSYAFWSNRGDEADMTLTRQFDFSGVTGPLTIEYRTWYEIEAGYDYAYLLASLDGETWEILHTPSGTPDDPSGNSYGWAYNGVSGGWLLETVDLSAYAGRSIWLRFEYITDAAVNGEGLLIDDVSIPQIGYFSDFETGDGGWEAAGFVRLRNILPQMYALSLISVGPQGVEVTYLSPDAGNRLEIPLAIGGDVEEVVLVVSGTTRFTRQRSGYTLEVRE